MPADPVVQPSDLAVPIDRAGFVERFGPVFEQSTASLFALTPEQAARIERMNAEHQQKFGFPFIIAAMKHTREQILSAFEQRLALDAEAAFQAGLAQVEVITGLRIARLAQAQEQRP